MKHLTIAALAALTLFPAKGAFAQNLPGGVQRSNVEDSLQVTAVGRVQSELSSDVFVLTIGNQTFRVSYSSRVAANRASVNRGDRVRVVGEITEAGRIVADQVQVLGRGPGSGGPGRPGGPRASTVVTGSIRSIDRQGQLMFLSAPAPDTNLRVTWDEDVEFYRNTTRSGPGEFRAGDRVRVVGRRQGNEFRARRVIYGGQPGWTDGGIGEIVSLDARDREAEIDFDGEIWTVRLGNAVIRRNQQRMDIDDLRLGNDVRVFGTARGQRALDASRIELTRSIDGPGGGAGNNQPGNRQTFEGRVVNVAEGRKTFRIESKGMMIRIVTSDETNFQRGAQKGSFSSIREGGRVRVTARRQGEEWLASR
ncbi:MAG: DUF5666 domain-containing protein, partial [Actinomycetota bacterium]